MLEALASFGLGSYEARALAHLLRHGSRTGPDLSRETGIPFGRIYGTLRDLEERGLVHDKGGRPRSFEAAPPQTVPARLLAAEQRRLQETGRQLESQAAQLERQLATAVQGHSPASASSGVRVGEDAARAILIEATNAARHGVDAYLALEAIRDEDLALFDAFRQAVARGVHTRVLLRESDVEYLMRTPFAGPVLDAMLPHLGQTLQVRLTRSDIIPFSVLDARRVMIGVRNPLAEGAYLAVVHLEDPEFAARLQQRFDTLWETSALDKGMLQRILRTLQQTRPTASAKLLRAAVAGHSARQTRRARRKEA